MADKTNTSDPSSQETVSQDDIDAMMGLTNQSSTSEQDLGSTVSQEDIDALMGFTAVSKPPQESVQPPFDRTATVKKTRSVDPIDIINQDRVARSRMPTMEVLNDRFARSFRASIFNYLRVNADIIPASALLLKYNDFINKIQVPSYFAMVSMTPLRGSMLFILDPYFCYAVIEAFFGGNGKLAPKLEGRDFSVIEQRVFTKILEHAIVDFASAWDPIVKFHLKIVRADVKAQFVSIAAGSEIVVGSTFDIEMDRWKGKMYTCFPYHSVEPFREQLISGVAADQSDMDPVWKESLHKDVQNTLVTISVMLGAKELPLYQAQALRVGDILDMGRIEHAKIYAENVLIAEGQYGVLRNQYAVRLTKYRTLNEEDILKAIHLKKKGIEDDGE